MDAVTECANCAMRIEGHHHSLSVTLGGFGDAGMIDTFFDKDVEIELCELCARSILETRWGARALEYLNINAGHVCGGALTWTPLPTCTNDPDRHGWRTVYAVVPEVAGRCPDRAPIVGPNGGRARYGVYDDRPAADAAVRALGARGTAARVYESLLGNEREHSEEVDPDTWPTWWAAYNERWLRDEHRSARRALVRYALRHPARVVSQSTQIAWRNLQRKASKGVEQAR